MSNFWIGLIVVLAIIFVSVIISRSRRRSSGETGDWFLDIFDGFGSLDGGGDGGQGHGGDGGGGGGDGGGGD